MSMKNDIKYARGREREKNSAINIRRENADGDECHDNITHTHTHRM